MAREQSGTTDDSCGYRSSGTEQNGTINRRSYLKLAGVATAGAIAAATTATADENEYDVITVDPGERRTITVGSGETFENKLIDVTADNCACTITARGTNWTIRNVGWRGVARDHAFIACADSGGNTSTIENVYMGDGAEPGERNGLGIWLARDHSGHLDINGVNIQMMGDNSFYLSAPHHYGDNGTVHLRNCYSRNSWVAHYRLGNGTVENCVAVNEATSVSQRHGRGVWAWAPGPVDVRGCHFDMNGYHYSFVAGANGDGGEVTVSDTEWDTGFNGGYREPQGTISWGTGNGNNPEDFVPEGCPTSADEAASGTPGVSTTEESQDFDHTLRLEGRADYVIEVDGELAPVPELERYLEAGEQYGDDWADWYLTGSWTEWLFNGDLTRLDLTDVEDLTVYLDGEEIDPADYGDVDSDEADPMVLRMQGVGEYAIEVDGSLTPNRYLARYLEEGDAYGDDWADWYLTDSWTEWQIDGEITSFEVGPYDGTDPDITFYVGAEIVDPDELGVTFVEASSPSTLRIEGVGEYAFETDGSVAPTDDIAPFVSEGDAYGDDWAEWYLTGSWTEWEVEGEFTSFDVDVYEGTDPDMTFYLDGERVDPEELGISGLESASTTASTLRMEGVGSYTIETDGSIEPTDDIAPFVSEGDAYGDDWAEWYLTGSWTEWELEGDLTTLEFEPYDGTDPDITVYLDGEEIDPRSI